jgi:hypothetical protein
MTKANFLLFGQLLIAAFLCYALHKAIAAYTVLGSRIEGFEYSLETIYGFFAICSMVILGILIVVRNRNLDATGQAFMAATFVKMFVAYGFLYPALFPVTEVTNPGKMNFFAVFLIFLALETLVCMRLLNRNS